MMYMMTAEQRAQIVDALNIGIAKHYDLAEDVRVGDAIAMLKAMQPVEPVAQQLLAGAVLTLNELWNKSTVHAPAIADQLGVCRVLAEHATQSAQPVAQPLTDDQIETAYRELYRNEAFGQTTYEMVEAGIRYAEKHHGIGAKE